MRDRARSMVDRVTIEAAAVLDDAGLALVRAAVEAALEPRDALIEDDHDPRCLAPARTVRILLADTSCRDSDALAAAVFVDSVDGFGGNTAVLTDRAAALLESVPLPTGQYDDSLLERLVTAPPAAAVIALAERLDQARHVHLRPDLPWDAVLASVRDAYIPAARRAAPRLEQRLARWADAFERRLLLRRPRSCDG